MLTGTTLRTKSLTDACGVSHVITIIEPAPTAANRSSLLASEKAWKYEAGSQPVEQRRRAEFAADVAYIAAGTIQAQRPPDSHVIAAQDETGALRGLSIFHYDPGKQNWHLGLHTVGPRDQGGADNDCPLRGVGSEMLGADADVMATRICTTVTLTPLDDKARAFWTRRGFAPTGPSDLSLSCPGLQALRATYAHSPTDDQDQCCDDLVERSKVSLSARQRTYFNPEPSVFPGPPSGLGEPPDYPARMRVSSAIAQELPYHLEWDPDFGDTLARIET
ncbi:MAG TPA: hypothetical protein VMU89_14695 [Thermomicrobiaceae bacterium]|nr:hypothetical protein [Thermomicrobiaceae bacterium]